MADNVHHSIRRQTIFMGKFKMLNKFKLSTRILMLGVIIVIAFSAVRLVVPENQKQHV
jgi:hypothetical protein